MTPSLISSVACAPTFAIAATSVDVMLRGSQLYRPQQHAYRRGMRRPVIGITMDYGDKPRQYMLPYDYATSIERAGGLPWPLPFKTDLTLIPEIVDRLEGIVFSGGDDLDPSLYGETRHPK